MPEVKIPTKKEAKNNYKNYFIKAEQFLESSREAFLREKWNSVGLNAVHAAISANDALCVFYHGLHCVSQKHSDAVKLLITLFEQEEYKKNAGHLSWLIGRKNLVEYESRLFSRKEAEEASKHAERFVNWAESKLP